jgi:hypothetical protein
MQMCALVTVKPFDLYLLCSGVGLWVTTGSYRQEGHLLVRRITGECKSAYNNLMGCSTPCCPVLIGMYDLLNEAV